MVLCEGDAKASSLLRLLGFADGIMITMSLDELVRTRRADILEIAKRYGASNLRIFGSVARGEADEKSDIDFLVDMESGRSLLDLAGLRVDLRELLGRSV